MRGIHFITDGRGKKLGVIIDFEKHSKLWEDFYDILVANKRRHEPRETLEAVKKRLQKQGKLSA